MYNGTLLFIILYDAKIGELYSEIMSAVTFLQKSTVYLYFGHDTVPDLLKVPAHLSKNPQASWHITAISYRPLPPKI